MNARFITFMFWLPALVIAMIVIGYGVYRDGIYAVFFYLFMGIILILMYLWCNYWLNKRHEVKK